MSKADSVKKCKGYIPFPLGKQIYLYSTHVPVGSLKDYKYPFQRQAFIALLLKSDRDKIAADLNYPTLQKFA